MRFAADVRLWSDWLLWLGVVLGAAGFGLAMWTARLFLTVGEGTPAPWEPPKKLVVRGPYRHVRNPMISGALMVLCAEAIILQSWPIAFWTAFFFTVNALYFPLVEERGLEKRFGAQSIRST
jgi:protein-S-isoprenylcysteine O-methyltransferase Ste14